MRRRQVLKTLAASSVISIGAGTAVGRQIDGTVDIEQLDALYVVSGDETVETLVNPGWEDVKRVETTLDDDQRLVTADDECTAYCESNCPCYPCVYGCSDCCDPDEGICDDCDDDYECPPDETCPEP